MKAALTLCFLLFFTCITFGQTVEVRIAEVRAVLEKWNAAHNKRSTADLKGLVGAKVLYRGKRISNSSYVQKKSSQLDSYKSFAQEIFLQDVTLSGYSNGTIKCEFVTQASFDGNIRKLSSYVLLDKQSSWYVITGEGDVAGDQKAGYVLDLGDRVPIVISNQTESSLISPSSSSPTTSYGLMIPALSTLFVLCILGVWVYQKRMSLRKNYPRQGKRYQRPYTQHLTQRGSFPSQKKAEYSFQPVHESVVEEQSEHYFSEQKGRDFEDYVVQKFDKRYFKLKEWRSDKYVNGLYPESNMNPDLRYCFSYNGVEKYFEVECKFRTDLYYDVFTISEIQLSRYREYQIVNNVDVYLCLGLGGKASDPRELFLIPLEEAVTLKYGELLRYRNFNKRNFFMDQKELRLG